jgi:uncharacterized protein YecE (DUF72 family)
VAGQTRIGCAGWNIPKPHASSFPRDGSHLERYAQVFSTVEINSSFYRPHRPATYRRWAEAVPPGFAFAVKVPREITHRRRLVDTAALLEVFLAQVAALGDKLGPLLFQLPPGFEFEPESIGAFFADLRARFEGGVVCEPRHAGWFTGEADRLLADFRIARVAADPAVVPEAAEPGGWRDLAYHRLHGSPRIYYSEYGPGDIESLSRRLALAARPDRPCWCIFDNTALGAATANALTLQDRLLPPRGDAARAKGPD